MEEKSHEAVRRKIFLFFRSKNNPTTLAKTPNVMGKGVAGGSNVKTSVNGKSIREGAEKRG
jgi:hypothetical protein